MQCVDHSCRFSFDDLFRAVAGRVLSAEEKRQLYALSQPQRNAVVRQWVNATAGRFACEDRRGADGVIYTAFWERQPN